MHKHFRMIAISEHLKSHGHNGYTLPSNPHMTIPGIWEKLDSLYNLEVLDIRVRPRLHTGNSNLQDLSEAGRQPRRPRQCRRNQSPLLRIRTTRRKLLGHDIRPKIRTQRLLISTLITPSTFKHSRQKQRRKNGKTIQHSRRHRRYVKPTPSTPPLK